MGVALVMPKKSNCTCCSSHGKRCLTSCALLTRWSTLVLKWVHCAGCKAYKGKLTYSVTERILPQNNFML